ncbi:hypothetical protein [Nostoc sp.]|uniref:hypothetical protein n=1 Tax=Nostoc sp. TaxID=1180 RepID=UPI002FFB24A0
MPKDNLDLRGKAGYWGVVSHVGEYSCTVQTWDGDYTVKIEHLKLLELQDGRLPIYAAAMCEVTAVASSGQP